MRNVSVHFLPIILLIRLFSGVSASRNCPGNDKSDPFTAQASKCPFLNTSKYSTRGNNASRR